ncbi:MAG: hypothetical protein QXW79_00310 [Thermoplasmata archaeon]
MEIDGFCKLEYLGKIPDTNQKINVIATSLFKMDFGYKSFHKYTCGLEFISKAFLRYFNDFYFMLFIDDSILNNQSIYNQINKLNGGRFFLVHYKCPKYINDGKHIELFGTLVRFLPFFDYPGNNANDVIVIDADTCKSDIEILAKDYLYFKKIGSSYHYNTNMFYEILSKWALKDHYTVIANRQICSYKFPIYLLTDYAMCIKNKLCQDMPIIRKMLNYERYHTFPYGVDEYFLNYVLIPYMRENGIKYSVTVRYNITAPIYYLLNQKININTPRGKYLNEILQSILGESNNTNIKYLILKFDRKFYPYIYHGKQIVNLEDVNIAKKYYKIILDMWRRKDYLIFSRQTLRKILKFRKFIKKTVILVYFGFSVYQKYVPNKSTISI